VTRIGYDDGPRPDRQYTCAGGASTGRTGSRPGYHHAHTLEISDELAERLDRHVEADQTYEELIEELVSMYGTEGAFLQEGYSE